ncbi:hypothetical protein V5799_021647 [Amblyomma americanum]|uniref:Uncharacterized protein n=1 Tax=Amblyomma americanum TaxID=6943 RepID=A0AAQ4FN99_AMBAM
MTESCQSFRNNPGTYDRHHRSSIRPEQLSYKYYPDFILLQYVFTALSLFSGLSASLGDVVPVQSSHFGSGSGGVQRLCDQLHLLLQECCQSFRNNPGTYDRHHRNFILPEQLSLKSYPDFILLQYVFTALSLFSGLSASLGDVVPVQSSHFGSGSGGVQRLCDQLHLLLQECCQSFRNNPGTYHRHHRSSIRSQQLSFKSYPDFILLQYVFTAFSLFAGLSASLEGRRSRFGSFSGGVQRLCDQLHLLLQECCQSFRNNPGTYHRHHRNFILPEQLSLKSYPDFILLQYVFTALSLFAGLSASLEGRRSRFGSFSGGVQRLCDQLHILLQECRQSFRNNPETYDRHHRNFILPEQLSFKSYPDFILLQYVFTALSLFAGLSASLEGRRSRFGSFSGGVQRLCDQLHLLLQECCQSFRNNPGTYHRHHRSSIRSQQLSFKSYPDFILLQYVFTAFSLFAGLSASLEGRRSRFGSFSGGVQRLCDQLHLLVQECCQSFRNNPGTYHRHHRSSIRSEQLSFKSYPDFILLQYVFTALSLFAGLSASLEGRRSRFGSFSGGVQRLCDQLHLLVQECCQSFRNNPGTYHRHHRSSIRSEQLSFKSYPDFILLQYVFTALSLFAGLSASLEGRRSRFGSFSGGVQRLCDQLHLLVQECCQSFRNNPGTYHRHHRSSIRSEQLSFKSYPDFILLQYVFTALSLFAGLSASLEGRRSRFGSFSGGVQRLCDQLHLLVQECCQSFRNNPGTYHRHHRSSIRSEQLSFKSYPDFILLQYVFTVLRLFAGLSASLGDVVPVQSRVLPELSKQSWDISPASSQFHPFRTTVFQVLSGFYSAAIFFTALSLFAGLSASLEGRRSRFGSFSGGVQRLCDQLHLLLQECCQSFRNNPGTYHRHHRSSIRSEQLSFKSYPDFILLQYVFTALSLFAGLSASLEGRRSRFGSFSGGVQRLCDQLHLLLQECCQSFRNNPGTYHRHHHSSIRSEQLSFKSYPDFILLQYFSPP